MRIYQHGPGWPTGRGNLLTIAIPYRGDEERYPFYWEAVQGRITVEYKRLRKRYGLDATTARTVVWSIIFGLHMAQPSLANGAVQFQSQEQIRMQKELVAADRVLP